MRGHISMHESIVHATEGNIKTPASGNVLQKCLLSKQKPFARKLHYRILHMGEELHGHLSVFVAMIVTGSLGSLNPVSLDVKP